MYTQKILTQRVEGAPRVDSVPGGSPSADLPQFLRAGQQLLILKRVTDSLPCAAQREVVKNAPILKYLWASVLKSHRREHKLAIEHQEWKGPVFLKNPTRQVSRLEHPSPARCHSRVGMGRARRSGRPSPLRAVCGQLGLRRRSFPPKMAAAPPRRAVSRSPSPGAGCMTAAVRRAVQAAAGAGCTGWAALSGRVLGCRGLAWLGLGPAGEREGNFPRGALLRRDSSRSPAAMLGTGGCLGGRSSPAGGGAGLRCPAAGPGQRRVPPAGREAAGRAGPGEGSDGGGR